MNDEVIVISIRIDDKLYKHTHTFSYAFESNTDLEERVEYATKTLLHKMKEEKAFE